MDFGRITDGNTGNCLEAWQRETDMGSRGISPEECKYFTLGRWGKNIVIYNMFFDSIGAVELFLLSRPSINKEIFTTQVSGTSSVEFAGPLLEESIKYCVNGYDYEFDKFMELSRALQNAYKSPGIERMVEPAFVGHRPNVPAYIADAPKSMYRNKRVAAKKTVNIFMQLTYDLETTAEQIMNRGILVLNLVNLLERNGYIVQFRVFETSRVYNEVFLCEIVLKRQSEKLDPRRCYFPMCGKSFVRRILLRIKESMPFQENWHMSYGSVMSRENTRMILNMNDNDIYIGTPKEMGITGKDIFEDARVFLKKTGLESIVNVSEVGKWMNREQKEN